MPLVNMLALCGKAAPVVVLICDCTSHMAEGEKNTEFIMEYFSDKVDEFDPSRTLQTVSFLMEQQTLKKWVPYCVPNIQGPCPFMEENMCCLCFFVTWQKSIQFR